MKLYRIKDWLAIYENNRTRDLKHMEWLPIPNRHDGEGYTLTATQEDGAQLLGAWLVLLQVASKCELPASSCDPGAPPCNRRGSLIKDTGKPHDAGSISRITRLPVAVIERALNWFCSDDVQWMECVEIDALGQIAQTSAAAPHEDAAELPDGRASRARAGTERNGTEQGIGEGQPGPGPCSIQQALAAAPNIGVTAAEAEFWFYSRSSDAWMKGAEGNRRAVGQHWQHDMKQFTMAIRNKAGDAAAPKPAKPREEPLWAMRRDLREISRELDDIAAQRVGAWGDLRAEDKARRGALLDKKRELLRRIVEAEEKLPGQK